MGLRPKRRKPPVERIHILPETAADEIRMLNGLMVRLNETVQSLWDTVHDLRDELERTRPTGDKRDPSDQRPPRWQAPSTTAAAGEQVETLQRQVDELNGEAEYLWAETQWLRARLAAAREA